MRLFRLLVGSCVGLIIGCVSWGRPRIPTVVDAWDSRLAAARRPVATGVEPIRESSASRDRAGLLNDAPIATVNGRSIPRRRITNILLRGHGPRILEQLIVLDAAAQLATAKGFSLSTEDINREYERSLRRLVDSASTAASEPLDREAAERVLGTVLAERNISREEFLITVRRNAYLRNIVGAEFHLTDEHLRAEFNRAYAARARVRHIQLGSLADVSRVRRRLRHGEAFEAVAGEQSVNVASARRGGMLEPFSADDDAVPALLRETAFQLRPGEVSGAVRIGEWYHLIKLEEIVPPRNVSLAAVRDLLEQRARDRHAESAMHDLYRRLLRDAAIDIHDPVLRQAFETHRDAARP